MHLRSHTIFLPDVNLFDMYARSDDVVSKLSRSGWDANDVEVEIDAFHMQVKLDMVCV